MGYTLISRGLLGALGCVLAASGATYTDAAIHQSEFSRIQPVAGTGVHYFTTAIIHSQEFTATGLVQQSTEIVELDGDLSGRLLYQPTSVFDFAAGTLVNTGHQVYSGVVLDLGPVMIHDDSFRFEVDLQTGATVGEVHLTGHIAGAKVRCHLDVVGTGLTGEGDATFEYTGHCRVWKSKEAR